MTYASEVLADSPLFYCKADDLSGTSAADASGNSRPLTIEGSVTLGALPLLGGSTKSFDLAGSGGGCLSAVYAAWMPSDSAAFSIEFWFNADSLSGIRGLAGRDGSGFRGWQWYINSSHLVLDVPFVSPSSGSTTGSTALSTGSSYHVVLTYDGTTAKQYLNGSQDASCVTVMLDPNNRLTVGATAGGAENAANFLFDGRFDEIAYYGTALSSSRVAAHYAAASSAGPDATVTPPAATATAAAVVPVVSASSIVVAPAVSASAAAVAPTVGANGSATVSPPAATATATALAPTVTQIILAGTDTSNSLNGRRRRARASVVVVRPAAAVPSRAAVKYDKSVPYPPPTLVNGRPV